MKIPLGLQAFSPVRLLQGLVTPRRQPQDPRTALLAAIEEARRDWQHAMAYFQGVSEPELVDHAVLVLEAARRKYMYLVKQARQEEVISG